MNEWTRMGRTPSEDDEGKDFKEVQELSSDAASSADAASSHFVCE